MTLANRALNERGTADFEQVFGTGRGSGTEPDVTVPAQADASDRFRPRNVEVRAMRWDGSRDGFSALQEWAQRSAEIAVAESLRDLFLAGQENSFLYWHANEQFPAIEASDGLRRLLPGNWVLINLTNGQVSSLQQSQFETLYEQLGPRD